jgi:hypothetical protein
VKQTNLNIFVQLGGALRDVRELATGMSVGDALMKILSPHQWMIAFIDQTEGMNIPESRQAARNLLSALAAVVEPAQFNQGVVDVSRIISNQEVSEIWHCVGEFTSSFDREYRYLDVFTVTQKGVYDTRSLINHPEAKFPEKLRVVLPAQFVEDLKQAARCLAFDIPTASAFHICRATESLIIKYHEVLSGASWPFKKRDWKIYIEQLVKRGAPRGITDRLDEIREFDRNSYTHPETNVTVDEAPVLFELCTGVVYQMADEIFKTL